MRSAHAKKFTAVSHALAVRVADVRGANAFRRDGVQALAADADSPSAAVGCTNGAAAFVARAEQAHLSGALVCGGGHVWLKKEPEGTSPRAERARQDEGLAGLHMQAARE